MSDSSQAGPGDLLRLGGAGESGQPFLRIHVVQVPVNNQERSLEFYRDQLGFQTLIDASLPSGQRWIVVMPPDGSAGLALVKFPEGSRAFKKTGGWTGITLLTENIDAKYEEWKGHDVHFQHPPIIPPHGGGGARYVTFEDPDGNEFILLEFDWMTRSLEAERRAAAEKKE